MAYSVLNGTCVTLHKFTDSKQLYGFRINGEKILCNFNTSPNEKMTDEREIALLVPGDVNSDCLVNAKDYTVLIRYINNMHSSVNKTTADYNGNGKIDKADAVVLRYFLVNR